MSESNNPMDRAFREQLRNHEIQPSDHIWEGISKAVNKKSRRIWLILAPVLIILGAAIFYLIWSSSSSEDAKGVSEVEHTTESLSIETNKETRDLKAGDLKATAQNEQTKESSTKSSNLEKKQGQVANYNSSTTTEKEQQSNQKNIKVDKRTDKDAQIKKSTALQNQSKSRSENISYDQNNAIKKESVSNASRRADSNTSSKVKSNFNVSYSRPVYELAAEPLTATNQGLHRFEIAHFKASEQKQKTILRNNDQCALLYPKTNECPAFEDVNRRFQFDVYGLIGKKLSSLSTNDNVDGIDDYLNSRRSSETPLWNVGLGLRLSTQWTSGLTVRGGLQISQGQIRLNYDDESKKRVVVTVTQDTIVDEEGNITIIQDTTSITETNIIPVEDFNNFTQLDIPLTVGYTFLGREYDIELNAGVMFNLLFEKSGAVFNSEDELKSIDHSESGSINAYSQKLGLSIITSAAINYHLTEQFSVFAEPQLRYFLKPVSPELYELKESWFHVNLMLGGRYSF